MSETNKEHYNKEENNRRDEINDNEQFKNFIPVCLLHENTNKEIGVIKDSAVKMAAASERIANIYDNDVKERNKINARVSLIEKHINFTSKVIVGLCVTVGIETLVGLWNMFQGFMKKYIG